MANISGRDKMRSTRLGTAAASAVVVGVFGAASRFAHPEPAFVMAGTASPPRLRGAEVQVQAAAAAAPTELGSSAPSASSPSTASTFSASFVASSFWQAIPLASLAALVLRSRSRKDSRKRATLAKLSARGYGGVEDQEELQQRPFHYPRKYAQIGAATEGVIKKSDVICTIGPASWSPEVLIDLMDEGMTIMRCNMSHGDHEEQNMKLKNLEEAYRRRPDLRGKVQILMDTRGPEIRTGTFAVANSKLELKDGQELRVGIDYSVKGTASQIAMTYEHLPRDVQPGQTILVQDGTVVLEVLRVEGSAVVCKVIGDCKLGEKKNVNIPGVKVDLPVVGEREQKDIREWAVPNKADYIALSFVQSASDVEECRRHCGSQPIKIISKIENIEGLRNFDAILEASDGIMVARGDLGMEIPLEKVWMAQKVMLNKCKAAGKFAVCATEMLASMENKPRPTRAEACDVANAILDGADAVMLSGESATGRYPVQAVRAMSRICEEVEVATR
mmetsp:Transcript_30553/g.65835  ORF Transcript_30553/g.65835 Transcript_30553/m.65835 type:complete len:504 (-) Transcript_30553:382-1893(-)